MSVKHIFKEKLESGVRYDVEEKKFIFDFEKDEPKDIINLVDTTIRRVKSIDHAYFFGYEFKHESNPKLERDFLKAFKKLIGAAPLDKNLQRQYIIEPVTKLCVEIRKSSYDRIDSIIYPSSNRTRLNYDIVWYIARCYRINKIMPIELIKDIRKNIKFNWDRFEHDNKDSLYYKGLKDISNSLINSIKNIDSGKEFSIERDIPDSIVKLKDGTELNDRSFRQFFQDYLIFPGDNSKSNIWSKIEDKTVLVVDDINVTHSTLLETITIVKVFKPKCIIILTILGKTYKLQGERIAQFLTCPTETSPRDMLV